MTAEVGSSSRPVLLRLGLKAHDLAFRVGRPTSDAFAGCVADDHKILASINKTLLVLVRTLRLAGFGRTTVPPARPMVETLLYLIGLGE